MARNDLRIIGGKHKGRKLRFADAPDLRPTLGRVRETLFNWLVADVPGARCLDAFAGSGALGFEALSRGAAHVTFVERRPRVAQALEANVRQLNANADVRRGNGLTYLSQITNVDIVFLDPPYRDRMLDRCLAAVYNAWSESQNPDARPLLVYVESGAPLRDRVDWESLRESRAGQAHFALLRPTLRPTEAVATITPNSSGGEDMQFSCADTNREPGPGLTT